MVAEELRPISAYILRSLALLAENSRSNVTVILHLPACTINVVVAMLAISILKNAIIKYAKFSKQSI